MNYTFFLLFYCHYFIFLIHSEPRPAPYWIPANSLEGWTHKSEKEQSESIVKKTSIVPKTFVDEQEDFYSVVRKHVVPPSLSEIKYPSHPSLGKGGSKPLLFSKEKFKDIVEPHSFCKGKSSSKGMKRNKSNHPIQPFLFSSEPYVPSLNEIVDSVTRFQSLLPSLPSNLKNKARNLIRQLNKIQYPSLKEVLKEKKTG